MSSRKGPFRFRLVSAALVLLAAAVIAPTPSNAQNYYELLKRAPDSANMLVLVNVDGLLSSPIAHKEDWARKQEAKYLAGMSFPPDSKLMLQASKVDWTDGMKSVWDVSLIALDHDLSIPSVARSEGGYVDKVEGIDVAYSPRNAFFVSIAPKTAAMMLPANRQELSRWLSGVNARKSPAVSKYLDEAVKGAGGKAQFVVACDTTHLLAMPQVRARLRESASLAGKNANLDQIAGIVTGLRGVTFSVTADQTLEGKLRVDFADITDPLKPYARDLIVEVLESHGVTIPELRDWRTQVHGKAIHFEGRLSTDSLRTLSNIIAIPTRSLPTGKDIETANSAAKPATGSQSPALVATKRYFQEITDLVNDLRTKSKSTQNYNLKLWADRYALQVDRLPVLNVDPEVLAYGTYVSETLRNIRNVKIETRATEKYNRAATFGDMYYSDNIGPATVLRRQADAILTTKITEVWTALENSSAQLRKAMSLKYQVEF